MRVALLVVALVLVGAPSAVAGDGKGKQAELKEAKRLFDAAPYTQLVAQRPASLEEVAAVAAQTEGLDPAQAQARVTGAAAVDGAESEAAAATAAAVYCMWAEWHNGRGYFPYRRTVVGQTYWCYEYAGAITYRTSNTVARTDGVCSGRNPRDWKVGGGAGYSWVAVHHEADFSCATPWWYPLNDSIWMEPAFNSYGNTWMTRMN